MADDADKFFELLANIVNGVGTWQTKRDELLENATNDDKTVLYRRLVPDGGRIT